MSNKQQLQTNNIKLDALIERVNAAKDTAASLPEAGGSGGTGSIETCVVTFTSNAPPMEFPTYYYTDGASLTIKSITTITGTITVPVNTIIAITGWNSVSTHSGSASQLFYEMGLSAYQINGDCTLIYRA